MRKLHIVGFYGEYGGASSELRMQIELWLKAFPEIELHIIPTMFGYKNEPLYEDALSKGITIHEVLNFESIEKEDAVINFCSAEFLDSLPRIKEKTDRIMWANCMTFLFPKEKAQCQHNYIKHFLYQRPQVLEDHKKILQEIGCNGQFHLFAPYFEQDGWEFSINDSEFSNLGRISRQDSDKFSRNTLHIWEYIVSPKLKKGRILGFDQRSQAKIGKPMEWVQTFTDQRQLPVKEFYKQTDILVQSTDTTENWPRIGFEAMYSGVPLVVDNKGGWKYMIEHGVTGFLCNNERDFIYYGSRLCYDFELRNKIAIAARIRAEELGGYEISKQTWSEVFEKVFN